MVGFIIFLLFSVPALSYMVYTLYTDTYTYHKKKKQNQQAVKRKNFNAHLEVPTYRWYEDLCARLDKCKTEWYLDNMFDPSDFGGEDDPLKFDVYWLNYQDY